MHFEIIRSEDLILLTLMSSNVLLKHDPKLRSVLASTSSSRTNIKNKPSFKNLLSIESTHLVRALLSLRHTIPGENRMTPAAGKKVDDDTENQATNAPVSSPRKKGSSGSLSKEESQKDEEDEELSDDETDEPRIEQSGAEGDSDDDDEASDSSDDKPRWDLLNLPPQPEDLPPIYCELATMLAGVPGVINWELLENKASAELRELISGKRRNDPRAFQSSPFKQLVPDDILQSFQKYRLALRKAFAMPLEPLLTAIPPEVKRRFRGKQCRIVLDKMSLMPTSESPKIVGGCNQQHAAATTATEQEEERIADEHYSDRWSGGDTVAAESKEGTLTPEMCELAYLLVGQPTPIDFKLVRTRASPKLRDLLESFYTKHGHNKKAHPLSYVVKQNKRQAFHRLRERLERKSGRRRRGQRKKEDEDKEEDQDDDIEGEEGDKEEEEKEDDEGKEDIKVERIRIPPDLMDPRLDKVQGIPTATLTPELREMACLVGTETRIDWKRVMRRATPELRALLEDHFKLNPKSSPLGFVVKTRQRENFTALQDRVRKKLQTVNYLQDERKNAIPKKAIKAKKGRPEPAEEQEDEEPDEDEEAEEKKPDKDEESWNKAPETEGRLPRSLCGDLPDVLIEFAELLEDVKDQHPNHHFETIYDWDYIGRKASDKLKNFLDAKMGKVSQASGLESKNPRRQAFKDLSIFMTQSVQRKDFNELRRRIREYRRENNLEITLVIKRGKRLPLSERKNFPQLRTPMFELAEILEDIWQSHSIPFFETIFEWDYINSHSSKELLDWLESMRKRYSFKDENPKLDVLVPRNFRETFKQLRGRMRQYRKEHPEFIPVKIVKKRGGYVARKQVASTFPHDNKAAKKPEDDEDDDDEISDDSSYTEGEEVITFGTSSRSYKLPSSLKELAILWELFASKQSGQPHPNWDVILARASPVLRRHIKEAGRNKIAFRDDPELLLVDPACRGTFDRLRAEVRKDPEFYKPALDEIQAKALERRPKELLSLSRNGKRPENERASAKRVRADDGSSDESEKKPRARPRVSRVPASPQFVLPRGLMKELARLVGAARSEGRTWSYIESHASPGLSQKIREAAVVHVNYLESPLDCLVQGRRDEFEELIRVQPAMTDGDRYDEAERLLRSFAEHMRQQLSDFEMQQTALLKKK
jgi:hypothetical protein